MKKILIFLSYTIWFSILILSIWFYYALFLTHSLVVLLVAIILTTIWLLFLPFIYQKAKLYYCKSESDKWFKTTYILIILFLTIFAELKFVSNDLLKNNFAKKSIHEKISDQIDKIMTQCMTDKLMQEFETTGKIWDFEDYIDKVPEECLEKIKSL